ncbi:MAG: DUF2334 domain-containing protein [Candidatus Omnitrophica bacterium]|nr:DUF2334 domain-containing protein [Candidatus Omnitrophota bacterium]
MSISYIVRLDDACPTMRRSCWDPIEDILDRLNIKPIVGVIPDNRDPKLMNDSVDIMFWDRVKHWQAKGWTIAMHGLHHQYHPIPKGACPLLPFTIKSEFVGLPLERQRELLATSYAIFTSHGIEPTMFMAPSHSFDENTLEALKLETPIRVITDGIGLYPYQKLGVTWIPQQMACFRKVPFGVWTICLHLGTIENSIKILLNDIHRYSKFIVSAKSVLEKKWEKVKMVNSIFSFVYRVLRLIKQKRKG